MEYAKIRAQVTVELTISLILLTIFLLGAAKVFAWLGSSIVNRHVAYESTRTAAGDGTKIASQREFYTPEKLKIFSSE